MKKKRKSSLNWRKYTAEKKEKVTKLRERKKKYYRNKERKKWKEKFSWRKKIGKKRRFLEVRQLKKTNKKKDKSFL